MDSEAKGDRLTLIAAVDDSTGRELWTENPDGLDSLDALSFLLSIPEGLKVSFAFNYDVSMFLRGLPFAKLNRLREKHVVSAGAWRFRHIPGKRFWVGNYRTGQSVQIWDVWSWWARSFAHLLDSWEGLATPEEREVIRGMKKLRDRFDTLTDEQIRAYCLLECKLLSRWVRILIDLHHRVGLKLRSYCGPGSTASAIYSANGWKPPERDGDIVAIATSAFYGGRNEVSAMGSIAGPVYNYDIGSAYPYEISRLPEIRGWKEWEGEPEGEWWGYADVEWKIPRGAVWGPFPMRGARLASGRALSLTYPLEGRGIYHSAEVDAARAMYPGKICVRRFWAALRGPGSPFSWVRGLAAERLRLKAHGAPEAYPLKVGLNSLYGKMVQRSGKAPYRDVVYGAAVTAGTRARLLRVLVPKGRDAILAATDGILTTSPVDGLDFGTELGQWEAEEYPSAFLAQSGVYWLGDKIRTRGFRKRSLTLDTVRTAWLAAGIDASVQYSERRFIGYRLACHRNRPEQVATWRDGSRHLYLTPFPRREPDVWNGDILYTRPPSLEAWKAQVTMDTALLDLAPLPLEESLSEKEDPEWTLER